MYKKNLENYTPHLTVVSSEESGWKHGSPHCSVMAGQGHGSGLMGSPGFALGFCSRDYSFHFQPLNCREIVAKLQQCTFLKNRFI